MKSFETNWTKEELNIYVLIYCAIADFVETKEEIDFIQSKVEASVYEKMKKEFEGDNDFESIQKIQNALKRHGYSESENEALVQEIKALFLADGQYGILERNLLLGMNRIFNQ